MIDNILMKQVDEKAIDSSPYFCNKRLWETVQDLQRLIRLSNSLYLPYYIEEYEKGRRVNKKVNIRHQVKFQMDHTRQYKPKLGVQFSRN